MKSLSKNLVKSGNVIVKSEGRRVIDSNTLIAQRIQTLSAILEEEGTSEDFVEGFTAGLNADQVEQLLVDPSDDETDIQAVSADAAKMVENANEEAERILADAREGAAGILEQAKADAEALKAEAVQNGHGEGYQTGYDEGLKRAKEVEDTYHEKEQQLFKDYEQKLEELEPQFVEALTGIYEHIFHVDLSEKKEIILYLLKDTVRNIEGGKNFLVHVSKTDFEFVSAHKQELFDGIGSSSTVEVIEDLTLPEGQCFVEAESGIFDCSLGTELSLLKKELKLLSYTKE